MERVDVFVIGGGGTGSEIAFRLGRHGGHSVALAERDKLGGECNHYGCVPTKVMLRSAKIAAQARDAARFGVRIGGPVEVDLGAVRTRARDIVSAQSGEGSQPFERIGVRVFLEEARLAGEHRVEMASGQHVEADRIILATGSEATVPPIAGLAAGPYWTNKEAIWKPERVPATLVVIGAGAVGMEFAQIYARYGSSVTVVEAGPRILPMEDEAAAAALTPAFEAEGITLRVGRSVERAVHDGEEWILALVGGGVLRADELLVATGRRPALDVHDLDAAGVAIDQDGLPVLGDSLRTTNPDVWAAGDATGELLFTHVGAYEAGLVVDDILGRPRRRDYRVVPRVTFSDPEVASVGLTEQQARDAGLLVRTSVIRFDDNERARIDGATAGFVKLVADDSGQIVGGHIVGEEAGAMIHEVAAVMAGRIPASEAGAAIHAYPTRSEAIGSALLDLADH